MPCPWSGLREDEGDQHVGLGPEHRKARFQASFLAPRSGTFAGKQVSRACGRHQQVSTGTLSTTNAPRDVAAPSRTSAGCARGPDGSRISQEWPGGDRVGNGMTWTATLGWAFTAYALLTGFYIALENRRPQATLAWMLLFLLLPGAGLA